MQPTNNSSPLDIVPTPNDKQIKLDYKRNAFDKELRALITQSREVIESRYGASLKLGNIRPELECLNLYLGVYNNMTPQEHYCYFETLYNRNRSAILNCLNDDRWIRTGRLVIQFGEGIKAVEEQCKLMRIMLTDIFQMACDLQSTAQKSLDGLSEEMVESVGGKDLIRPNIILLHLMRIFYHLNDGDDKKLLGDIVTRLETDVGSTAKTVGSEPWITPPTTTNQQPITGGLSGLFTMATNMMEKIGYKPPAGMKPPTETEISTVLNSVFNNDATQNAIQSMFSSLQGSTDFSSAVSTVVQKVTDPTTMSAIQESVLNTAQIAALSDKPPSE